MKINVLKSVVFLGLGFALQAPVIAQAGSFRCENNMYRQSILDKSESLLQLQDTFFRAGHKELNQLIEKQLALENVSVHQIRLLIDKPDEICSSTGKFSISCSGSATGGLTVEAYVYNGPLESIKLRFEVSIKNLKLETKLANEGNNIGNKNIVTAHATGTLLVGETEVPLQWDSFFHATDSGSDSTCREN